MSILHPQNLIKMQWARYESYDVSTLEEYLHLLSPDKSSEHIDQLHNQSWKVALSFLKTTGLTRLSQK